MYGGRHLFFVVYEQVLDGVLFCFFFRFCFVFLFLLFLFFFRGRSGAAASSTAISTVCVREWSAASLFFVYEQVLDGVLFCFSSFLSVVGCRFLKRFRKGPIPIFFGAVKI